MIKKNYEKIKELSDNLTAISRNYLEVSGWKESCNHPDFCWRWEKTINKKLYVMNYSNALQLQLYLDEQADEEFIADDE